MKKTVSVSFLGRRLPRTVVTHEQHLLLVHYAQHSPWNVVVPARESADVCDCLNHRRAARNCNVKGGVIAVHVDLE